MVEMTMLQENFHLLNSRYFRGRLKNVAVHVEQWDKVTTKTCHGGLFNKRMKQLAVKGAFNGLW